MPRSTTDISRLATLALALLLSLSALAQDSPNAPAWNTFAARDDRPRAASPAQTARLVFLRPQASGDPTQPAHVFVGGRLLTALLPGGFSEVEVCPGLISVELGGQGAAWLAQRPRLEVQARAGQTVHVMVKAPHAALPLRTDLSAEQARVELAELRRQAHALSRVPAPGDCALPTAPATPAPVVAAASPPVAAQPSPPPPAAVASKPAAPLRYTLSAEALFRYGGSRVQDLSEQGQTQIVRLASQIRQQLRPGQVVLVQGHTDPTGTPALNKRLSRERADTVRRILINSGLPSAQVRAEAMGSSQLLVKDCATQAKTRDDRISCNRPNRRVEITIAPPRN